MAIAAAVHPSAQEPPGDACASCGAPQVSDQRYCLECGARRRDLTPLYLRPPPATEDAPSPVGRQGQPVPVSAPAAQGPTTALALLGCLLLAMGVGVLIGRSGNRTARPAPTPAQVINVSTPGGASGAAATSPTAASAKQPRASKSSGPKGQPAAAPAAIQALQNSTGKQYEQRSKNLPKTTTTGGKPPPIDHKAPGAGSGSVTIG